jgi:2-polyprenyl-3-methyl-5-hydroxy-6-metoxy-1,4-benzoquinol methylase
MIGNSFKQLGSALRDYLRFYARRLTRASVGKVAAASGGVRRRYEPVAQFDWQALSDPESQIYTDGASPSILEFLVAEPKFVLDVGCSIGDFTLQTKKRFPGAKVWGVEPNARAAATAASRIDRVLIGTIDDVDWRREGVAQGDIDTVLLMDVLEHIYDPWRTLLTLRNLVAAKAQMLVSMPNVRNVLLIQDLLSGHWRYRRAGLLDITHIRFFTRNDMQRMFYQTGFRIVRSATTQCPGSMRIFEAHRGGGFPKRIDLGSASLTVQSLADLDDLCAVQHVFTLQPADYQELSADERAFVDGAHPPTLAFSPDG